MSPTPKSNAAYLVNEEVTSNVADTVALVANKGITRFDNNIFDYENERLVLS